MSLSFEEVLHRNNFDALKKNIIKVNIIANSTWSGLLSYFQGIKIKRFTKW
jgi:hypothetical protein